METAAVEGRANTVGFKVLFNCYKDGEGGPGNASMMEGGDLGYPNNDIAKDEIIMKLRSQNVKLRQKLKELNSALDVALEKA
jgi:hypothetical protein